MSRPRSVNPPFNRTSETPAGQREVYESHKSSGINAYYDLYPDARPHHSGNAGCPCEQCCHRRGRETERER